MSIANEIERLVALKESGHITEEEFRVAKARLISPTPSPPPTPSFKGQPKTEPPSRFSLLPLPLGVFVGNFLYHTVLRDNLARGFIVGVLAALLTFLLLWVLKAAQHSKAEPPGTGQPANRPVDKPEGGDKPQPEAAGRSR